MLNQLPSDESEAKWFALRVRPRHEKSVAELIKSTDLGSFLPIQQVRRRWAKRWKELELPLFPGYVFACFAREHWIRVINVPGVIDAVRFGKLLAPVDELEIRALRLVEASQCDLEPCPYLTAGQQVQIVAGPLVGLIGTVTADQGRSELILSVTLLQRSVRVKTPREWLEVSFPTGSTIHAAASDPRACAGL